MVRFNNQHVQRFSLFLLGSLFIVVFLLGSLFIVVFLLGSLFIVVFLLGSLFIVVYFCISVHASDKTTLVNLVKTR